MSETSKTLLKNFKVSKAVAENDSLLISQANARPGRSAQSANDGIWTFATTTDDGVAPQPPDAGAASLGYSPLDRYPITNCISDPGSDNPSPPPAGKAKATGAEKAAATQTATVTVSVASQATLKVSTPDGTEVNQTLPTTTTTTDNSAKPKETPAETQKRTKTGCSYESIHARQMALNGFKLADSFCYDYFSRKRTIQNGNAVVNDFASGATSLAGAVAGLVAGTPAAPAAIASLVGITNQATTMSNKDFLFGTDNIDNVYQLAATATLADTKAALPDPDISDWNYDLAVGAIRRHQEICNPATILALIKQSVQKAVVKATEANGASATACNNTGAITTSTPSTNNRPTTKATTVAVVASPGCAQ